MGRAEDLDYLCYLANRCHELEILFLSKKCPKATIEEIQRIFLHREVEYLSEVDYLRGER